MLLVDASVVGFASAFELRNGDTANEERRVRVLYTCWESICHLRHTNPTSKLGF